MANSSRWYVEEVDGYPGGGGSGARRRSLDDIIRDLSGINLPRYCPGGQGTCEGKGVCSCYDFRWKLVMHGKHQDCWGVSCELCVSERKRDLLMYWDGVGGRSVERYDKRTCALEYEFRRARKQWRDKVKEWPEIPGKIFANIDRVIRYRGGRGRGAGDESSSFLIPSSVEGMEESVLRARKYWDEVEELRQRYLRAWRRYCTFIGVEWRKYCRAIPSEWKDRVDVEVIYSSQ